MGYHVERHHQYNRGDTFHYVLRYYHDIHGATHHENDDLILADNIPDMNGRALHARHSSS